MSLLNGTFAGKFSHDSTSLQEIGVAMKEIIYTLVDTHFFNRELEVSKLCQLFVNVINSHTFRNATKFISKMCQWKTTG